VSLAELRAQLVAVHPGASTYRGGGAGRMLPIAQILADWATPAGQAVIAQWEEDIARDHADRRIVCGLRHPGDAGRNSDRRLALKRRAQTCEVERFAASRADAAARLAGLAAAWTLEEQAAADAAWRETA
jgi:hypothetical protein